MFCLSKNVYIRFLPSAFIDMLLLMLLSFFYRQLDSTVNANALNTDVKDSSMVIDEDKKEVKKDIKADLAKIDNPNKDVSMLL